LIFNDTQQLFIDHSKTAITLSGMYDKQDLSKQWAALLAESIGKQKTLFALVSLDGLDAENSLLREYIDRVNSELLTRPTDEVKGFYRDVLRPMYKSIQSLEYFSNELISCVGVLNYLSQWSTLVQVRA
jgi:hypothetical protein